MARKVKTFPEFKRHFTREDVIRLFSSEFRIPENFLFGVANSGFQTEGGYNMPACPLNNWWKWEQKGKVEPSGEGIRFWEEYEKDVEVAKRIGLNAFRFGIEWARLQPSTSPRQGVTPPFDANAIEHYSDILASVMNSGMEPVVTLHHFTHPAWLGLDFWLDSNNLPLFIKYVEKVALELNTSLLEKHSLSPIRYYTTLNEPNALATGTYLIGTMPRGRKLPGIHACGKAWSNMLAAHCLAYDRIHEIYESEGWEEPRVTFNTAQLSIYWLDKFAIDLLCAKINGIGKRELREYLRGCKDAWDSEISKCPVVWNPPKVAWTLERILSSLTNRLWRLEDFETAVDALFNSFRTEKLDWIAVDFYDPFSRHMVLLPSLQDIRENIIDRRLSFHYQLWNQVLNPRALYHFLKGACLGNSNIPIVILESGMAYKVYRGRVDPRRDIARRDHFLQSYIFEAMRALSDGIPLSGYFYWTLFDNYEWGSYEPCFGLYGVDRTSGVQRKDRDAWGIDAGKAYADIIKALRSGDAQLIADTLTRDY